jgi:hypothetical protein
MTDAALPIEFADRLLLAWFNTLPIEQQRSAATIAKMRSRNWSWATIGQLTQLSPDELAEIVRGDRR